MNIKEKSPLKHVTCHIILPSVHLAFYYPGKRARFLAEHYFFYWRRDTTSLGSSLVDTGEFAVPLCDGDSDWLLQTRNIILHVSAAFIGYTGPALHQAVALDGNIINSNTVNFKTNSPFRTVFPALY